MYQNPFALKPGEILTPQELFDRFLDWTIFNKPFVSNPDPACDNKLLRYNLCCHDHLQYRAESDTFCRYFDSLEMLSGGIMPLLALSTQNMPNDKRSSHLGPFTPMSLSYVISTFKINIDREKYLEFWGENGRTALNYLL